MLVAAAPGAIVGNVFAVLADYRSRRVIATGGAFGFAAALAVLRLSLRRSPCSSSRRSRSAARRARCATRPRSRSSTSPATKLRRQFSRAVLFGAVGDLLGPVLLIVVAASGLSWRVAFRVGAGHGAALRPLARDVPLPAATRAHAEHDCARRVCGPIVRDPRVWYFGVLAAVARPARRGRARVPDRVPRAGPRADGRGQRSRSRAASVVGALVGFVTTSRARLPATGAGDAQPDGRHHGVARRSRCSSRTSG